MICLDNIKASASSLLLPVVTTSSSSSLPSFFLSPVSYSSALVDRGCNQLRPADSAASHPRTNIYLSLKTHTSIILHLRLVKHTHTRTPFAILLSHFASFFCYVPSLSQFFLSSLYSHSTHVLLSNAPFFSASFFLSSPPFLSHLSLLSVPLSVPFFLSWPGRNGVMWGGWVPAELQVFQMRWLPWLKMGCLSSDRHL